MINDPNHSKIHKCLHAYRMKKYWLKLFSATSNDRNRRYGLEYHSFNRRYELANFCYEYWYYECSQDERKWIHFGQSDPEKTVVFAGSVGGYLTVEMAREEMEKYNGRNK